MSSDESAVTRLIVRVKALLPEDWRGRAGRQFRAGTQAISSFAEQNDLLPGNLLEEGIELGRRKLTGLASQEHAAAEKNYAEAIKAFTESEDRQIEIELKKRALEIDLSKKEADVQKARADARKANAEASLIEIHALDAESELLRKLNESGMALVRDQRGNLMIFPKNLLPPSQEHEQETA